MENKRIRKTYDRDFKVSVMKLILEKHQSVSKVSRDLRKSEYIAFMEKIFSGRLQELLSR